MEPSKNHDSQNATQLLGSSGTPNQVKNITEEKKSKKVTGLQSLVAGGFGGVCSVIVGHPFDLIKVRLQTAEKGHYRNSIDVVRQSVTRNGLRRGLYAGITAPLAGVTPMFAVSFWSYDVGKSLVHKFSRVENEGLSVAQVSAAGFFSAIPTTLVATPFERIKVLLQIQGQKNLKPGEKPKYSGGFDAVLKIYREGGIRSVFRGSLATFARDSPGSAVYFATYEVVKRRLTPIDPSTGKVSGELSLGAVTIAGASAGIAMWIPVFPIDTVKSRLQTVEGNPKIGSVIRGLYTSGGLKAFFPGIGPALARAAPANAATFLGVELAHSIMNKLFAT
ncbi:unnamed protein product [Blumeria hordei]|uniref:Uncharacterized protein n=2 Tax=Blumeria hordei TaxID=2867405 RepID=A0A383UYF7_BLUHO|nr:mitochondrial carnitine / acylcarnitine carrier [Blumeria hordei DH14]SZF04342.1 unnamed protein product [Blumeria hordei]